jgi:hypothetical protein
VPSGIPSISSRNTGGGSFFTPDLASEDTTSASLEVAATATRNIGNGASYFARISGSSAVFANLAVDEIALRNINNGASYFARISGTASGDSSISGINTGGGSFFTPDMVSETASDASLLVGATSTRNISNGPSYFARIASQSAYESTFSVDAVSLRNIYAGASYFPRLDTITTPNFAPVTEVFDLIAGTTMTQIGSSQTLYVGLFEDGTENKVSIPLPTGTVSQLTVESSVAASSNGDYVYTVMKEGSAQTMTISMSAGQTSASTTANQVSVASGDTFSVKIVTSASAPSAFHRYSVKYTMT